MVGITKCNFNMKSFLHIEMCFPIYMYMFHTKNNPVPKTCHTMCPDTDNFTNYSDYIQQLPTLKCMTHDKTSQDDQDAFKGCEIWTLLCIREMFYNINSAIINII